MSSAADSVRPHVRKLIRYQPGRPIEEVAREFGFDPADAIKLASNENALGPSPRAIEAMTAAAGGMHRYPDGAAYDLTQAVARRLNVPPDYLIFANGSNELIELLGHVFLEPGAEIVMADCSFVVYGLVAALFEADRRVVPMVDHVHDLDAILSAISPDTRLVFVSNPNNPTGTVVTPDAMEHFLENVPSNVVAVIDEAYIELLPAGGRPNVLQHVRDDGNVIVLRTFSKTYGLAGMRVGYAVGPPWLIHALHQVRQPFNVSAMAQAAAVAALQDDDHVKRTQDLVREGLRFFEDAFRERGLSFIPSAANFICVDVGAGQGMFERMQAHGVVVRPLGGYGLPRYIRITIGTPAENSRCLEVLDQLR